MTHAISNVFFETLTKWCLEMDDDAYRKSFDARNGSDFESNPKYYFEWLFN